MIKNLLVLFCLISIQTLAQNQAANWYFGKNSGIHFDSSSNTVTPVFDGKINTLEGCATISDHSGNLLFYTDGVTVWNRNHNIMLNGNGLLGDPSSSQSAIIVPKPNHPYIYYIFTVDYRGPEPDTIEGLNYSEVDLTLDGGLGKVTSKNIKLLNDSAEKITAVLKDCRDKSIWLLTYASKDGLSEVFDTFHSFEITETGVNKNSVKSTFPKQITDRRGYLKLSPDGLKLACANSYDGLDVYDFDITTGKITNPNTIILPRTRSAYGVEFSPNSDLLYVHTSNIPPDEANINDAFIHNSQLVQFDLTAANIPASAVVIDNRRLYRGALQLGPNGKIYRALSASYTIGLSYLGVINEPNKKGVTCDYVHQAIDLSPSESTQGLPPFISSFFNKQIDIIKNGQQSTNLNLCEGAHYTLRADPIAGASYTWTKNGRQLLETSETLTVYDSGYYEVTVSPNNGDCDIEGAASVIFNPNPTVQNMTLLQCKDDAVYDGKTIFNLNEVISDLTANETDLSVKFYLDTARTNEIIDPFFENTSNPQIIYASVVNNNSGCTSYAEISLEVSNTNIKNGQLFTCDDDGIEDGFYIFDLNEADDVVLDGLTLALDINYYETYEDALLEQNPLDKLYQNNTAFLQTIFARAENHNNCYGISSIELKVQEPFSVLDDSTLFYCLNKFPETITLDAGLLNDSPSDYTYLWNTGATTYSIDVNATGVYTVKLTNKLSGCDKTRKITVEASNLATINEIDVVDVKENNMITIIVSGEGTYQYQLTHSNNNFSTGYQDSHVFENVYPGLYTVSVKDIKNDCGIIDNQVSVIGFPKFFTPNNDGINDTWQVYGISEVFQPNTKILIFNRYGKLLKELHPLGEGWNGTYKGDILPQGDYWFSVKLADGRLFKNHFTLKH